MGGWGWEAPRGFIDKGETPEQAALRELAEETGMFGQSANILELGTIVPEGGVIRARSCLFAVQDCRLVGSGEGEVGVAALHWFDVDEGVRMAEESVIDDASTCVGLFRLKRRLLG